MTTTTCARKGCGHDANLHSDLVGCTANDSVGYCTCQQFVQPATIAGPITPYDGGTSSGHSGTDTSAARAKRNDADGTTAHVQQEVARYLYAARADGATIRDLRAAFPRHHHGTLSGALSVLHKAGNLARLTERRDRCAVYVDPAWVNGRDTEQQASRGKAKPTRDEVRKAITDAYYGTRNDGGTMTEAADRATAAVMALL